MRVAKKTPRAFCNDRGGLGLLSWGQSGACSAVCHVADVKREMSKGSNLFAGTNCAGQAAVVHSIGSVPQRLTEFNATAQNFDLLWAASRCIGRNEVIVLVGNKIFIVTITQNGFENVLASTHVYSFNFSLRLSSVACGVKLGYIGCEQWLCVSWNGSKHLVDFGLTFDSCGSPDTISSPIDSSSSPVIR